MPLQSRPVQACDQAAIHGSMVQSPGSANRLPSRISAIGFTEVTSITYSGSRKNAAPVSRKAYTPMRAGVTRGGRFERTGMAAIGGAEGGVDISENLRLPGRCGWRGCAHTATA